MSRYSLNKGLLKAMKNMVLFGLPVAINVFVVAYPDWAQLSLGGALVLLVNWLKIYVGLKLP